jgi:uncharacterized membrane protein YhaH (DUF805 family)
MIDIWKLVVTERYAKFDGRAGRAEYWWFFLANMIVVAILFGLGVVAIFFELGGVSSIFFILYTIYALAMILPSIAVGIRRLHDTNKSGWWLLIALIPFGSLVIFVFTVLPTAPGPNQYGEFTEPAA